jgi:hypothetical protein
MPAPRPDLLSDLGEAVGLAYNISLAGEYHRAMEGKGPMPVVVCLGSGRCLYPYSGSDKRVCAFCRALPGGFTGECNKDEALRQHIAGH